MADQDAFGEWLDSYAQAMSNQDPGRLRALFSDDACFCKTPFDRPVEGVDAIVGSFAEIWERIDLVSFEIERIADGWAHWARGGTIHALDEPSRTDGVLKAELGSDGRCKRLTFWSETMSVRESDMLSQRDA